MLVVSLTTCLNDDSYDDERPTFMEAPQNEIPASIEAVKELEAETSEEDESVLVTPTVIP